MKQENNKFGHEELAIRYKKELQDTKIQHHELLYRWYIPIAFRNRKLTLLELKIQILISYVEYHEMMSKFDFINTGNFIGYSNTDPSLWNSQIGYCKTKDNNQVSSNKDNAAAFSNKAKSQWDDLDV